MEPLINNELTYENYETRQLDRQLNQTSLEELIPLWFPEPLRRTLISRRTFPPEFPSRDLFRDLHRRWKRRRRRRV